MLKPPLLAASNSTTGSPFGPWCLVGWYGTWLQGLEVWVGWVEKCSRKLEKSRTKELHFDCSRMFFVPGRGRGTAQVDTVENKRVPGRSTQMRAVPAAVSAEQRQMLQKVGLAC